MSETLDALSLAWQALTVWEALAVLFGIAYLLLAVRENILCWYAALASTLISIYLFWDVSLLMESALNVFYAVMAVYGWYQWRYGQRRQNSADPGSETGQGVVISRWPLAYHWRALILVLLLSLVSGALLSAYSQAAWPYLDSFTSWGSVVTTYMVAKKILENWLYWIVIDGLSVFLYFDRELYLYALLFMAYLVIVVIGYFQWRRQWSQQNDHNRGRYEYT